MAQKALETPRSFHDVNVDARQRYIDRTSISDEDLQKMIQQLMRTVGTQVAQNQNRSADNLFDAPLATQEAADRGAEIRGNEAIGMGTTALELEQNRSVREAEKNYYNYQWAKKLAEDQQDDNLIAGLFSSIGGYLATGGLSEIASFFTGSPSITNDFANELGI